MLVPRHPNLQRLAALWQLEVRDSGSASLGRLSARDLQYFYGVFKDSFVARGPKAGPFRLSFIGTDLESHIGRRIINADLGDCFDPEQRRRIRDALVTAAEQHRLLLIDVWLENPQDQVRLRAEILCLPFHELEAHNKAPGAHSTTIFGTLAIEDLLTLPPEPPHRALMIERVSYICPK
jgi:PAS domain